MASKKSSKNDKKTNPRGSSKPTPFSPFPQASAPATLLTDEEHLKMQEEVLHLRQVQTELEDSREWLSRLFDDAPIGYVLLDSVGLILEANARAASLLGRRRDVLPYCSFRQFLDEGDYDTFVSHLERCRTAHGEPVITQLRLNTTPPRSVELTSGTVVQDHTNSRIYHTTIADRTALFAAQQELQQNRERYRLLFNALAEVVAFGQAVRDAQGKIADFRILEVNGAWERYMGVSARHAVGRTFREVLPDVAAEWQNEMVLVVNSGRSLKREIRGIVRDRWLTLSAFKVLDDCIAILLLDITERKQAEEALLQSEREDRLLFDENPDPMWIVATDTLEILRANSAACTQYWYTRDEFLTLQLADLFVPEMRGLLLQSLQQDGLRLLHEGIWKHLRKDGSSFDVEIATHQLQIGGRTTRLIRVRDVTARVQAEQALRKSEEFSRRIIESSADCILVLDLDGRILSMNSGGERLLEIADRASLTGTDWITFWREEDWPRVRAALGAGRLGGTGRFSACAPTTQGTPKWWDVLVTPILDVSEVPERLLAVSRDVTEQRKTEAALRQREQQLRYHVENSPLAVIEWNADYVVQMWSGEAERLFGLTAGECVGRSIADLGIVYPEDVPVVQRTMERLTGGMERTVVSENRNTTRDGRVIHCVWYNSVLTDGSGKLTSVLSLVENVTPIREASATLQRTIDSLRVLVSLSTDSMVLLDTQGKVVCNSRRAASALGYLPQDLEGKEWKDLLPQEQEIHARFYLADLMRDPVRPITAALKLRTAAGEVAWYSLSASVVALGSDRGFLVYLERV